MKNDAANITTGKLMTHNNQGFLITFQIKKFFIFNNYFNLNLELRQELMVNGYLFELI